MNLYEAIEGRRDIRHFRPDPIGPEVLARILLAAHHAGSVGFMQPWNFIVIDDIEMRREIRRHVESERLRAAEAFEGPRREKYLSFKLEGILDAPINLCVTCDRSRSGPAVLGRYTIPETDIYSTCCAIQNLWLAARSEGVGVGWVSILETAFIRNTLGIPEHVFPVAYLCLGYPHAFPQKPMLETEGWLPRAHLNELVYNNAWGNKTAGALSAAIEKATLI